MRVKAKIAALIEAVNTGKTSHKTDELQIINDFII